MAILRRDLQTTATTQTTTRTTFDNRAIQKWVALTKVHNVGNLFRDDSPNFLVDIDTTVNLTVAKISNLFVVRRSCSTEDGHHSDFRRTCRCWPQAKQCNQHCRMERKMEMTRATMEEAEMVMEVIQPINWHWDVLWHLKVNRNWLYWRWWTQLTRLKSAVKELLSKMGTGC